MTGERVAQALRETGRSAAVAESVTGGQVCAAVSRAPGSSDVFRGGVVAYTVAAKERLLGVPQALLAEAGPVAPRVAVEMAERVVRILGADLGVSTTGVAGPAPHGGHEPGFAYVGWSVGHRSGAVAVNVAGDRTAVRDAVTAVALEVLTQCARTGTVDSGTLSVPARTVAGND